MEKHTVTSQPRPEVMDVYNLPLADEEANAPCHRHCHIARLRQLLIPVVLAFLALVGVLLLSPFDITGGHSLFSRAVDDAGSSTGSGSFVDNKLYLIVVFVGLVVVVILGVSVLSFPFLVLPTNAELDMLEFLTDQGRLRIHAAVLVICALAVVALRVWNA
ncbi:hypothetical protein EV421DRAFT_1902406 [Armillaria borealis]|uniref:Transmembrane protein n=1 Tax=Armillaria borealis TaxID=47425 RepID=A0AA39JQ53_9AGAR|nr:hypothetical protein EV421DRAFT_1902406 [Armillaria borealis]